MAIATKTIVYRDIDLNMRAHPESGKLIIRKNNDAVKQGVRNLILTNKFERPYRPLFGCDIRTRLFENMVPTTEENIKSDVEIAFDNYMPRAILLNVGVVADNDANSLRVNIVYRPINVTTPVEITLILERAR